MSNNVANWASNVRGAEYNFLPVVVNAFEQFNKGNTTEIAKLLCITNGRKSGIIKVIEGDLLQYAAPLKRIMAKVFEGVEVKFNSKKKSGVDFKMSDNGGANTDQIEGLRVLGKVRVTSKAFKKAFPVVKKETDPKTPEQIREQFWNYMEKFSKDTGLPMAQVKAIASAKQAA